MKSTIPTMPDLSSDYILASDDIKQYKDKGHVLLRSVASTDEISAYQPAIRAAADRFNTETRPLEERDTYARAFLQIINLWERDEAVRQYTLAKRFAKIAADLMEVDEVHLYHDQALFKEPGGGPTPWHQDEHYWPLDTDNTITLWMPLVDIPKEVGSMLFGSGSHRMGYLGDLSISDKSDTVLAELIRKTGIETVSYGAMKAGDATFHAGWTLHSAPGNPTPNMREVMTVIYYAGGTHLLGSDNPRGDGGMAFFPGLNRGDLAEGPRTPLVFKR